jgi:ribosome-binding factor A
MSIRTERVAEAVKHEISALLQREIDTSGYGLLTVTDVIMTADLRLAKVYVSHFRSEKTHEEVLAFLDEHLRTIRMAVGRAVRLKFTPELRFYIDETLERVERIEQILADIHRGAPRDDA